MLYSAPMSAASMTFMPTHRPAKISRAHLTSSGVVAWQPTMSAAAK